MHELDDIHDELKSAGHFNEVRIRTLLQGGAFAWRDTLEAEFRLHDVLASGPTAMVHSASQRSGEHVALTLRPAVWAGEGLLGAKIGPPAAAKAEAKKGPLSFD